MPNRRSDDTCSRVCARVRPRVVPAAVVALVGLAFAAPVLAQAVPEGDVQSGLAPEPTVAEKIAALNAKILADPKAAENYNDLGVLYAEQEDWPLARDAFIRAVQARPQIADYHRNLGLVFQKLEDYDLAVAEFEMYKNLGMTGDRDGWRLIGRAREQSGDPAGAIAAYDEGLAALGRQPLGEVMRLVTAKARVLQADAREEELRALLESFQPVARQLRDRAQAADPPATDGVAEAEAIEHNLVVMYLENGRILEESDLPGEAADLYAKLYELAPDRDDILPHLVGARLGAGDLVAARAAVNLAKQQRPESSGTWIASGKVAERADDLATAVADYHHAYEIDPATPGLATVIGNLYMKMGRAAEGRAFLAPQVDDPDTPPEVVYNYAVSLMQEKKYAAALPSLRRVVRERPDFAAGWSALGQALRATEKWADAVAAYQKAMELAPDARVAYNLGVVAGRADRADVALAAYAQAVAWDPQFVEAWYNYSLALMKADRHEEALAALDNAEQLEPSSYRVFLNQGVALFKLKRYQDAIARFTRALELKQTAEAYDNTGLAYQALGDKVTAQKYFLQAKSLRGGK